MRYLIPFALFGLVLLCSCPSNGEQNSKPVKASSDSPNPRLRGDEWSLEVPEGWRIDTSGDFGTLCMLEAPAESETDQFSEVINLARAALSDEPGGGRLTLEQFVRRNLETMSVMFPDWELLTNEKSSLGAEDAIFISYTAAPRDTAGEVLYAQWGQWFCYHKGAAWLLTFSGEQHRYEGLMADVQSLASSFQFE